MSAVNSAGGFGPVAPQEHIETLDILRGFAIFARVDAELKDAEKR